METKHKEFTIEFYTGQIGAAGDRGKVSDLLQTLSKKRQRPVIEFKGMNHEIRDLRSHNKGASFTGVFAKYRADDLPHAGAPGKKERELDLDEDEGLIEKNYFHYFKRNELLVYQRNGNGSTTSRLAAYLSDFVNETVAFNPVIQEHALRRLMKRGVTPKSLVLSIARPTNPDLYPDNQWNSQLFDVMNSIGGVRLFVRATTDIRSTDATRRSLHNRVKRAVAELIDMEAVTVARLNVEEDDITHPIDLLMDRIFSKQPVEMKGRYPVPESINAALRKGREEQRQALQAYFGAKGRELA